MDQVSDYANRRGITDEAKSPKQVIFNYAITNPINKFNSQLCKTLHIHKP